jgi:hypothetical protein
MPWENNGRDVLLYRKSLRTRGLKKGWVKKFSFLQATDSFAGKPGSSSAREEICRIHAAKPIKKAPVWSFFGG